MRRVALSAAFVVAGGTAVLSADAGATRRTEQVQGGSMSEFVQDNPDCLEFNDQCSFCVVVDGAVECSTPQIACVKQKNACTKRASR